jgi:hypothetical protein
MMRPETIEQRQERETTEAKALQSYAAFNCANRELLEGAARRYAWQMFAAGTLTGVVLALSAALLGWVWS